MVERLVPAELYELFQQVVPPAPTRPQGGGRGRHGDREVLAAIKAEHFPAFTAIACTLICYRRLTT